MTFLALHNSYLWFLITYKREHCKKMFDYKYNYKYLSNLDKPPSSVLLHIKVKPLRLNLQCFCGKFLLTRTYTESVNGQT